MRVWRGRWGAARAPDKRGCEISCLAAFAGRNALLLYSAARRSRRALPTTLTDDSAMAAAAITGESRMPKTG
jgi:hypothetical protein